jgi:hypothetical protein
MISSNFELPGNVVAILTSGELCYLFVQIADIALTIDSLALGYWISYRNALAT